jgi:hypothetical protein
MARRDCCITAELLPLRTMGKWRDVGRLHLAMGCAIAEVVAWGHARCMHTSPEYCVEVPYTEVNVVGLHGNGVLQTAKGAAQAVVAMPQTGDGTRVLPWWSASWVGQVVTVRVAWAAYSMAGRAGLLHLQS